MDKEKLVMKKPNIRTASPTLIDDDNNIIEGTRTYGSDYTDAYNNKNNNFNAFRGRKGIDYRATSSAGRLKPSNNNDEFSTTFHTSSPLKHLRTNNFLSINSPSSIDINESNRNNTTTINTRLSPFANKSSPIIVNSPYLDNITNNDDYGYDNNNNNNILKNVTNIFNHQQQRSPSIPSPIKNEQASIDELAKICHSKHKGAMHKAAEQQNQETKRLIRIQESKRRKRTRTKMDNNTLQWFG
eukprot:TRINITY_DN3923_c0_g1_i1.p1 TRINITY_DN3923_c0_g1~~TRINITY_DN3923_c0_g1_i1.p1  ORF type:complete len:259 (+),score=70.67 TRINITY_DN3923_c0_g1_i1:54-779(+)